MPPKTLIAEQVAAGLAALLQQDDLSSGRRRLRRGREAGGPGTDHEDVGMQVDPAPAPMIGLMRDRAEPGLRADERFDERPRPARSLEDLVVEAGRHHERERVQPSVDVAVDRGPRVLAFDAHPLPSGLRARSHVGDPVDLHQAVWTRAGHALQSARPVVLERAARDRHAGGRQRRSHRVSLERRDHPAFESEADRPVAPDRFALTHREPLAHAGAASRSIP
jgi:hypothetical protein